MILQQIAFLGSLSRTRLVLVDLTKQPVTIDELRQAAAAIRSARGEILSVPDIVGCEVLMRMRSEGVGQVLPLVDRMLATAVQLAPTPKRRPQLRRLRDLVGRAIEFGLCTEEAEAQEFLRSRHG